ncbi:MAG TPA: hypothetical protein VGN01_08770 [Acidobacteriaceae bacterium]
MRSAFLLGAVTFIGLVVISLNHPVYAAIYGPVPYYGMLFGSGLLAVLYGAAWLTTRKPSPYRNNWAVAASSLSLLWGLFMAFAVHQLMPERPDVEIPAVITIMVSISGLYLYAPGGSPGPSESAKEAAASVVAKEEAPVPRVRVERRPMSEPTALAPSVAALRASSPEFAAAAASPEDPNAPQDPLSFIRTHETLQRLRS